MDVTICTPAYRAAGFLEATAHSVLAQTHDRLTYVLSVDPAGDGTEDLARRIANEDRRVVLNINPVRKGWVGNTNQCLSMVSTPFFAFCMHDDLLRPDYVARLRARLVAHPAAQCAGGAVLKTGAWYGQDNVADNPDITGSPFARLSARLSTGSPVFGLRDLQRDRVLRAGLRFPEDIPGGFAADLAMVYLNALAGDYIGGPEVLCEKVYGDSTVTASWRAMDIATRFDAEVQARVHLIGLIARQDSLTDGEKAKITEMILARDVVPFGARHDMTPSELADHARYQAMMDQRGAAQIALGLAGTRTSFDLPYPPAASMRMRERLAFARGALDGHDPVGAANLVAEAARANPASATPRVLASRAWRLIALKGGRIARDRAIKEARRATELDPSNAQAWANLALNLRENRQLDAAHDAQRQVVELTTGARQDKARAALAAIDRLRAQKP